MFLSSVLRPWLQSDEPQFGFKRGQGYLDAIYTLRGIVSHINNSGLPPFYVRSILVKHSIK